MPVGGGCTGPHLPAEALGEEKPQVCRQHVLCQLHQQSRWLPILCPPHCLGLAPGQVLTPRPPLHLREHCLRWLGWHLPLTSPWPGPGLRSHLRLSSGRHSSEEARCLGLNSKLAFRRPHDLGQVTALRFGSPVWKLGDCKTVSSWQGCVGYGTGVGIIVERLGAERCGPQISESDGAGCRQR